jgi:hypothetical protein
MKNRTRSVLVAIPLLLVLGWMFVGFDRYVGDHEVGSSWDPFMKSTPDLQIFFVNPVQRGLEFEPPDQLDDNQKALMRHYCEVRYGATDMPTCYRAIKAARY